MTHWFIPNHQQDETVELTDFPVSINYSLIVYDKLHNNEEKLKKERNENENHKNEQVKFRIKV